MIILRVGILDGIVCATQFSVTNATRVPKRWALYFYTQKVQTKTLELLGKARTYLTVP